MSSAGIYLIICNMSLIRNWIVSTSVFHRPTSIPLFRMSLITECLAPLVVFLKNPIYFKSTQKNQRAVYSFDIFFYIFYNIQI